MPTCIYCAVTVAKPRYAKREHVMPQAFGVFEPDNPVLWEEVCEGRCEGVDESTVGLLEVDRDCPRLIVGHDPSIQ